MGTTTQFLTPKRNWLNEPAKSLKLTRVLPSVHRVGFVTKNTVEVGIQLANLIQVDRSKEPINRGIL